MPVRRNVQTHLQFKKRWCWNSSLFVEMVIILTRTMLGIVSYWDKFSHICLFVCLLSGIFRHVHTVFYRMPLVYRLRWCPHQTHWFYSYRVFVFSFFRAWQFYHIETKHSIVQAAKYVVYMETKKMKHSVLVNLLCTIWYFFYKQATSCTAFRETRYVLLLVFWNISNRRTRL